MRHSADSYSRSRCRSREYRATAVKHECRLHVEPLEDRRMLAVITVDSLADNLTSDGLITLREAIEAANNDTIADAMENVQAGSGADTIEFDPALFISGPQTILLSLPTREALTLLSDITITGPGAALLTIDASENDLTPNSTPLDGTTTDDGDGSSVFVILGPEISVSIAGLSLTGGDAPIGGGIVVTSANLNLYGLVVYGNKALNGGGIHVLAGGANEVAISNSIIGHTQTAD